MGKSENLPLFCNQNGQRWEEGFGGDNLLLCSPHQNRGSEMQVGLVLITEKVLLGEKKETHLSKTASWPPPHNQ